MSDFSEKGRGTHWVLFRERRQSASCFAIITEFYDLARGLRKKDKHPTRNKTQVQRVVSIGGGLFSSRPDGPPGGEPARAVAGRRTGVRTREKGKIGRFRTVLCVVKTTWERSMSILGCIRKGKISEDALE